MKLTAGDFLALIELAILSEAVRSAAIGLLAVAAPRYSVRIELRRKRK